MFWRCVTVSACVLVALVSPWASGQPSGSWAAPSCGNPQWVTTLALRADGALLAGTGDGQTWHEVPGHHRVPGASLASSASAMACSGGSACPAAHADAKSSSPRTWCSAATCRS